MIVDGIVVVILLVSALIAFLRGFIREVLTIFGIVGGMLAAYIGGPIFKPLVRGWFGVVEGEEPQKLFDVVSYQMIADVVTYASLLVVFVIIFSIISHFISEFAKTIGLGALDRTLGVVFGLVRGVLLLGLLYLPFFYLADEEQTKAWFEDSRTQPYVAMTSQWISDFIPQEAKDQAAEGVETLDGASEARKKLEEMDLLGTGNKDQDSGSLSDAPVVPKKDGYTEEFRENMDQLFQQNTQDQNSEHNR